MNINKEIAKATGVNISTVKKILCASRSSLDVKDVIKSPSKKKMRNKIIEIDDFAKGTRYKHTFVSITQ